ncbi:MAG: acyl carrier protein [Chloroflexota bacterium]|nr:acyl carrier protein [Chloroflexota bacterium]
MRLEELFGAVLDVPAASLTEESGPETVTEWDSFGHITLITAMEETYGVSFETDEIQKAKSLGDARDILRAKGVEV